MKELDSEKTGVQKNTFFSDFISFFSRL